MEIRSITLPYTQIEAQILPLSINEITRLYDIVVKKNINFVEDFLRRRVNIDKNDKLAAVNTIKQFEFEYILLETLKLYTNMVTVPSITDPSIAETYYLRKIELQTPKPKHFYVPTVFKDYLIENELNKYISGYLSEYNRGEDDYGRVLAGTNMQIAIMLVKVYNLQSKFEEERTVKLDFTITAELFDMITKYNKERPRMIDTITNTEFKIRPEMFTTVMTDLLQIGKGVEYGKE